MIYNIYIILTIICSPIIDLYMFYRYIKNKEDKKRFRERFGFSTIQRPKNKRIFWFQCASIGESNSVMLLIEKLLLRYNDAIVLITSGTKSSAQIIMDKIKNKKNIIHQYTPIDKYFVIKRFLKFWKPEILITVESEIWPNMITMAHKYCKKVMIVNAKISKNSYGRWKFFKNFRHKIFDSIDICYTQSKIDEYKLINLGIQNSIYLGNIKFDIPSSSIDEQLKEKFQKIIKNRKVIFCSLIHMEEIEIIIKLYKRLQNIYKDLLFVVAIRHPNFGDKIYKNFISEGLNVTRESMKDFSDKNLNIYLYDKFGNLDTLYNLFDIVLLGGSLVKHLGGHSPIEAAKQNCVIVTGPYISNNKVLFLELSKNNACIIINDKKKLLDELENKLNILLTNNEELFKIKNNVKMVCSKFSNVSDRILNSMVYNLENDDYND